MRHPPACATANANEREAVKVLLRRFSAGVRTVRARRETGCTMLVWLASAALAAINPLALFRGSPASNSDCWIKHRNAVLNGAGLNDTAGSKERCARRYKTLRDALDACARLDGCDGVTQDSGIMCQIEGGGYGSAWGRNPGGTASSGGGSMPFEYELRRLPPGPWTGMTSWVRADCDASGAAHGARVTQGEKPVKNGAAVLCDARTKLVGDALRPEPPAVSGAAMARLERRSAEEFAAAAEIEDAQGCPRDRRTPRRAGRRRGAEPAHSQAAAEAVPAARLSAAAAHCGSVVPLIEQLATLPPPLRGDPCPVQRPVAKGATCELREDGRNDGWGGQHMRRVATYMAAMQLGCAYRHAPLLEMNAHSKTHRVDHQAAEQFFGMSHACAERPPSQKVTCIGPFSGTPVDLQPLRVTSTFAAACNQTVGTMLAGWRAAARGKVIACEEPPTMAPLSRCTWLRSVAALRARYLEKHQGAPPLPAFASAPSALGVNVALHVRRGDIWQRDRNRCAARL
mgnify:CR=1 FL=1